MKINIIGTGLFNSGGMRIIFEYANRLSKRGHDICYYYPVIPYKFNNESFCLLFRRFYWNLGNYLRKSQSITTIKDDGFKIIGIPVVNEFFVRNSDAVIATQWPTAFDVKKLSIKKGKKFYFLQDYEIWDADVDRVNESIKFDIEKITISNYNREFFRQKFGIETKVIMNGIDYNIYFPQIKKSSETKVITFIEHYLKDKGVENAIDVVKKLNSRYTHLQFKCFGHSKYHELPDFVKFYENPSDAEVVKEIYGKTDIFIYPSLKEGFALPPAEAMACKCAVVTTNVGAIPEYSIHMESALHVKPGDTVEMFNAVCFLLDNEVQIQRLSENASSHIRQVLNWEKSVDKFEDVLKSV